MEAKIWLAWGEIILQVFMISLLTRTAAHMYKARAQPEVDSPATKKMSNFSRYDQLLLKLSKHFKTISTNSSQLSERTTKNHVIIGINNPKKTFAKL